MDNLSSDRIQASISLSPGQSIVYHMDVYHPVRVEPFKYSQEIGHFKGFLIPIPLLIVFTLLLLAS